MPDDLIVPLLLVVLDAAIVIAVCARARVANVDNPVKLALTGAVVVTILLVVSEQDGTFVMMGVFHGLILCGGAWAVGRRTRQRIPAPRGRPEPVDRVDAGAFIANLLWFCGGAIGGVIVSAGLYTVLLIGGMLIKGPGIG